MSRYILTLTCISITGLLHAQVDIQLGQQAGYGGTNVEDVGQIIKTTDGGYVLSGYSTSGISGNKTTVNYGEYDGWIVKLNSSLDKEWEVNLGGNSYDSRAVLAEDDDGNFYVAMPSLSDISGNKTSPLIGASDFWLVKLSSTGNVLWQKNIGGMGTDGVSSIKKISGGFLMFGTSDSDTSNYKTETSRGEADYWFIKIDSDGNRVWDKTVGSSAAESIYKNPISINSNEEIVAVGRTIGNISGDKTENGYGLLDIWVTKLAGNGQLLWDKTIGGTNVENLSVVLAEQNSTTLAVSSSSDISGNRNVALKGNGDCWLVELNADGEIIRQKAIGGGAFDSPRHIFRDSYENLIISMSSNSTADFDKTEISRGGTDIWLISLDDNWNIIWQKTIGSNTDERPVETIETSPGQYIIVGEYTAGIPSGDLTISSHGGEDFFLIELKTNLSIEETIHNSNFKIYPNPTNGVANFKLHEDAPNGKYVIDVLDMTGKLIHSRNITNTESAFDFNAYPSGVYIVKLTLNGDIVSSYRIVVDRVY